MLRRTLGALEMSGRSVLSTNLQVSALPTGQQLAPGVGLLGTHRSSAIGTIGPHVYVLGTVVLDVAVGGPMGDIGRPLRQATAAQFDAKAFTSPSACAMITQAEKWG